MEVNENRNLGACEYVTADSRRRLVCGWAFC